MGRPHPSSVPPLPPRGVSRAFLRRYGPNVDPHIADKVHEYVQKNAIDRRRHMKVDDAVGLISKELGICKRLGYLHLNAGRWRAWRQRRKGGRT